MVAVFTDLRVCGGGGKGGGTSENNNTEHGVIARGRKGERD